MSEKRDRTPNMENKIALVWRENVRKLMDHYGLGIGDISEITGKSTSTIGSNFGGNKMVGAPSKATITKIERAFSLNQGTLGKPRWNPNDESAMANPKVAPHEQLATLNIPIPKHKMEQIMRILYDDD